MTWKSVITFESTTGDPMVVRDTFVESDPSSVARKAVFRALSEVSRRKYDSIVIVLDRQDEQADTAA
jgi:hypothetical protein